MELTSDHRNLIEKLIRSNPKFIGNEDLLEDFVAETYKRSYLLLDSITNVANLETYLDKVITTSMLGVLKGLGRIRKTKSGYINTRSKTVEEVKASAPSVIEEKKINRPLPPKPKEEKVEDNTYDNIEDPKENEENIAQKATLQKITNIIYEIDTQYPARDYFKIYYFRYVRNYKQSQVAQELKISQGELSKRLCELVKLIKDKLR